MSKNDSLPKVLFAGVAAALLLASACGGRRPVGAPSSEPTLRIGVAIGSASVAISGSNGLTVRGHGGRSMRTARGASVTASGSGGRVAVSGGGLSGRYERLSVSGNGSPVSVNGTSYRGEVEILARGETITAVNIVGVEEYLGGVVAREMGTRTANEIDALRVQAIASRTYALKNRGKWAASGFDLAGSVSDQAYGGVDAENELTLRAVRETSGEVLTYGGTMIDAFFHSTCGFATATPEEAFETVTRTPYLRSVSDRSGDGYYCDISPHFRWVVEWEADRLEEILRNTLEQVLGIDPADVSGLRALNAYRTGESGRLTELRIVVEGGEIPVTGPRIRQVLRRPDGGPLRSNAVEFSTVSHGGALTFRATGAGYGHGVGVCQWGAIGRARAGQNYRQILNHYLPGATIEKIY